jgi:hypothetical protein
VKRWRLSGAGLWAAAIRAAADPVLRAKQANICFSVRVWLFNQSMTLLTRRASKGYIKTIFPGAHIDSFLFCAQQVKEQCRKPGLVQRRGYILVARAVAAATAPMHKKNEAVCP